jgi:hypothetical protein
MFCVVGINRFKELNCEVAIASWLWPTGKELKPIGAFIAQNCRLSVRWFLSLQK